jgi:hypothetical protein
VCLRVSDSLGSNQVGVGVGVGVCLSTDVSFDVRVSFPHTAACRTL